MNNEVSDNRNVNADAACKDVASIKYDMQMLQIRWKRDAQAQQMDAVVIRKRTAQNVMLYSRQTCLLKNLIFSRKNSVRLHVPPEDNSFVIFQVPICSNFFFEECLPHSCCTFLLRSCLSVMFEDSIDIMDVI